MSNDRPLDATSPPDLVGFAGTWLRDMAANPHPPIFVITRNPGGDYSVRAMYQSGFVSASRSYHGNVDDSLLRLDSGGEFRCLDAQTLLQVDAHALAESHTGIVWNRVPADYPATHGREPGSLPDDIFASEARDNSHDVPAGWTDVAHIGRSKLIRGGILYLIAGTGLALFLHANNYRIPIGVFDNDRIIPAFFAIGILGCLVSGIGQLWLLASDCFFRAGRQGIWYKQPPAGLPFAPAKEFRVAWSDVTKWYPSTFSVNGIPLLN
jgi:hypothetical protein